jgi:hypothetical protein
MINLPKIIWIKIYEYDSTYREIYNKVLDEFIMSTPYWTMKSHLECNNIFKIYRMSQKQAQKNCTFWNKRYNSISLCKKITYETRNNIINNPIVYNYPEYVSDVLPNQPYFREKFYHKKKLL